MLHLQATPAQHLTYATSLLIPVMKWTFPPSIISKKSLSDTFPNAALSS